MLEPSFHTRSQNESFLIECRGAGAEKWSNYNLLNLRQGKVGEAGGGGVGCTNLVIPPFLVLEKLSDSGYRFFFNFFFLYSILNAHCRICTRHPGIIDFPNL